MQSLKQLTEMLSVDRHSNSTKQIVITEKARVEGMTPCWLLVSHKPRDNGYVSLLKKAHGQKYAHRLSMELAMGTELPHGYDVSHRCELVNDIESRVCVNPDHMVLETRRMNVSRSKTRAAKPNSWYRYGKNAAHAYVGAMIVRDEKSQQL